MRPHLCLALTALLSAACTPASDVILGNNQMAESRSGGAVGEATVTVAMANGNPCATSWNGQPVTTTDLTARGVVLIDQAIQRAGGIENVTEQNLPRVRLEAAPALTFACVGPVAEAIQRSGIAEILMKPTGSTSQPVSAYTSLTSSGQPPASATIELGPASRIAWNGEASDLAGVRVRAREIAEPGAPPGMLAVIVAEDVSFASAFELFEAVAGARPILLPPGSTLPPPGERGNGIPPPPVTPPR